MHIHECKQFRFRLFSACFKLVFCFCSSMGHSVGGQNNCAQTQLTITIHHLPPNSNICVRNFPFFGDSKHSRWYFIRAVRLLSYMPNTRSYATIQFHVNFSRVNKEKSIYCHSSTNTAKFVCTRQPLRRKEVAGTACGDSWKSLFEFCFGVGRTRRRLLRL